MHTYQKEQKGIKDVLEQVSQLFADHPDLLMEFTYFLPDAVQDQAKERLQRAARESDLRRQRNQQLKGAAGQAAGYSAVGGMMGAGGAGMMRGSSAKRARTEKAMLMAETQQNILKHGMLYPQHYGQTMPGGMGSALQQQMSLQAQSRAQLKMQLGQQSKKLPKQRRGLDGNGDLMEPSFSLGTALKAPLKESSGPSAYVSGVHGAAVPVAHIPQHHTISAERRFFDQVKDFLSGLSKDAWTEFVKILELFSNDALPKKEMLTLVEQLFGTTGADLFDEFKSLMTARQAYDSSGQDLWYGVPLSEIDLTQSRKCTPSYRALPKQYPKPLCSERSAAEAAVLNDEWVSIPIGSEDTYSFKHMRKNQYEEALFRSEDERFEIDMIIDSNMCTIRLLEPIAEEMSKLKLLDGPVGSKPRFNF